jgi:hypothetical protein
MEHPSIPPSFFSALQQNWWVLSRYLPESLANLPREIGVYEYVYEHGRLSHSYTYSYTQIPPELT